MIGTGRRQNFRTCSNTWKPEIVPKRLAALAKGPGPDDDDLQQSGLRLCEAGLQSGLRSATTVTTVGMTLRRASGVIDILSAVDSAVAFARLADVGIDFESSAFAQSLAKPVS